ncbi:Hypothetical predicted protein, partial [Mytilus galloprovincialis]
MEGFKLCLTNTSTTPPVSNYCYENLDSGLPNITQTIPFNHFAKYVIYYDDKGSTEPGGRKDGPVVELCYVAINDNLASDSLVWQNPSGSEAVNLTVDGNKTSCSRTRGPTVTFHVDLLEKGIVTGIFMIFGEHTSTVDDHTIYASNLSSTWKSGSILYKGKSLPTKVNFFEVLRYLTYELATQQPSVELELCEIGVIECSNGQFGTNCSEFCTGCISDMCDRVDGLCDNKHACKPGYVYGDYCNKECPTGQYGINCSQFCEGCISNICDHVGGLCNNSDACKPGYVYGDYCNEDCENWYFGNNCSTKCNCLAEPCNKVDGICPQGGCKEGWHGDSWCDEGKFGRNCNDSCDGCLLNTCEATDGLCLNTTECKPGYYFTEYCNNIIKGYLVDEYCNKTCDDWYFGSNCTGKCYCLIGSCSRLNGICPSGGCQKGWHGESCEEAIAELQKEDLPYAATIGGGASAVILILLIVVVFIIYRRRSISTKDRKVDRKSSINETSFDTSKKTSNNHNYANIDSIAKAKDDTPSVTESEDTESQIVQLDDVNLYGNVLSVLKYKIMIEDLKTAIHEKQKGEDFKKEYAILQKGLLYPHVEGSKEDNKVKNRFLSLWPYDHSRVVLKGDTAHDYINASYIDNYEKEKAYIAAQGPKNETLRDFWHMIWQEKVGKVVMVTQLKENQKTKCAQYWPKSVTKPLAVNNYIVTLKEERKHTVYVYRLLTVLNKNDTNEQEREVHHFHFTQWPDHGVPDSIKLVSFYRKVKIEKCYQNGPMVVHCSAGVGRTGTFIAIDALYENGKIVGYVNVMECIEMMRKDRMNMVQTYEQYEAVFEALLELFTIPETSIPKTDFCKYISDQEHKTVPRNQNMYKVEFQRLETLRPVYPQSAFIAATSKENIQKNSKKQIFPHDKYRPYLMSYGKTSNDYINAVIVPGYEEKSKLLVTQCPLEKTVVDFWTMVYDHQSNIVVLLDQLNVINLIVTCFIYTFGSSIVPSNKYNSAKALTEVNIKVISQNLHFTYTAMMILAKMN